MFVEVIIKLKKHFILYLFILFLTGCSGTSTQQITIYKFLGEIQCQAKTGSIAMIRQELFNANIYVFGKGIKGDDGVARITVYGASTGEIGIFVIKQQDYKKAKALGFMQY